MRVTHARRIIALALFAALLIACGAPAATPTPAASTPQRIVIAAVNDPAVSPMRNMINEGLAEKALGFKVEWVDLTYSDLYKTALEQGKTSAYDLYLLDDPWVPQFALEGVTANLSALGYAPDGGFVPASLELGYWPPRQGARVPGVAADAPSQLFALPVIGDTQLFFYRKDLIDRAPETWEDIQALAAKADPANKRYLLAMRGVTGNPIVTEWFPYLYSFGGEMFDEQWNATFNSPEGIAALQLFVDLKQYQPAGVENFDAAEQGLCYLQGECMMNIEWTGYILLAEDAASSQVVGKTGWTLTPSKVRHASEIGNYLLGIGSGSANQAAALEFIRWFTGDEAQREFARRRGIPIRNAIFADQEVLAGAPWLATVKQALDNSVARPRTPEWARVEEILGAHLRTAVIGAATPEAALNAAAEEVKAHMTGKGYYK